MDRVLVVDDDLELCELLREYLGGEGFEVSAVHDGAAGLDAVRSGQWSLVILDVMLPEMSGLEVLRAVRSSSRIPIIMLTARGDDVDRILGLELGADDYLPKPFHPRELVARIRAVLRRLESSRAAVVHPCIELGDLRLDAGAREVSVGDLLIELTAAEFTLLEALVRAAGRVLSRDELSRAALGRRASSFDRSLDVHISSLRRKLGPLPEGGERIKTVRGVGYLYVRPAVRG
jgi:two-component system response regulator CpxR